MTNKLNIFISYSHIDELHVGEFRKHIHPLISNNLIDSWYDRKIMAGKDFQDEIDNNLENADIICLFISANFLSSSACIKERTAAYKLKATKGIVVIPIILSACGWLDDKDISQSLALPTDGKPIENHDNGNIAWNNVYSGLKLVIEEESEVKQLELTEQFSDFLESAELLTKAHSKKQKVLLDDIFVYPNLEKYDELREYEGSEDSEKIVNEFVKPESVFRLA